MHKSNRLKPLRIRKRFGSPPYFQFLCIMGYAFVASYLSSLLPTSSLALSRIIEASFVAPAGIYFVFILVNYIRELTKVEHLIQNGELPCIWCGYPLLLCPTKQRKCPECASDTDFRTTTNHWQQSGQLSSKDVERLHSKIRQEAE